MRIDKIINNNIISARDSQGVELIAMGKGIGFGQKPGNEIDDKSVEKIFRLENIDNKEYFKELLASLPLEHIRLATDIISYAKESLGLVLSQNVYLTLTDHIGFTLNKHWEGMEFNNILYDEVKLFYSGRQDARLYEFVRENYKDEYQIINKLSEYIENEYECRMTEEKIIYLVLNIKRLRDLYTC